MASSQGRSLVVTGPDYPPSRFPCTGTAHPKDCDTHLRMSRYYVAYVQVPVWFCIACPIILGLLAPFVFNLGFGAVAEAVCEHYQLPQEECNDLW